MVCSGTFSTKDGATVTVLMVRLKPRLHGRFFARDFLKSSTKCGGYTRDNFVDSSKNIQLTEIIAITVDVARKKSPV